MYQPTIKTKLITQTSELLDCRDDWNELCGQRLFHSWEWLVSWWEQYGADDELAVVAVLNQHDQWVGIAPWFKTFSPTRGNLIRVLGSGAACSDYISIAWKPGYEVLVVESLLELMFGEHQASIFANIDMYEFEGHTRNDRIIRMLLAGISDEHAVVTTDEIGGTWRTRLPGTWTEFEKSLKKSFRRKTKKASKRLASGEFPSSVHLTPEQIDLVWPTFVDLHQRRRNSLGQPGCFADSDFEFFLKNATQRLAEYGKAQINLIEHEGIPLTCNLEFTSNDSVYMYQTGMDPDRTNLEPGHLTFTWAIAQSIERHFAWFDFLRGDEPYKRFWNSERVDLYRTRLVPNRFVSNLRYSIFNFGKQFRDWTRSFSSSTEVTG